MAGGQDGAAGGEAVGDNVPNAARCSPTELVFPQEICQSVRILKRVPRASRHHAATKLASILDNVCDKNDTDSSARLFKFSRRCLAQPRCGSGKLWLRL